MNAANPTNTATEAAEIKYHTPIGIYDIELVQFFEAIRDRILYKGVVNEGLCTEILMYSTVHRHRRFQALEIIENYMPHKEPGKYWWPDCYSPSYEPEEVEQGFHDRVAFLTRIIENLMCGV